ncbi:MAG: hypothetical protein KKB82_08025 [Candidatus Omnitrophica bacterium]|nr:hypothetical protein [Candidatus Omnitrophota bacterium]MBU1925850.1 hypothetical protein [Candidatus Omnitrophota bacterium]
MSKARAGKEIHVVADNKIGTLSDISQWLADKGINIKAVCAYVDTGKAHFLFVTSDNRKAMEILRAKSLDVNEEEVIVLEMQDKVGILKDATKKLKSAEVDIKYLYGTTISTANAPATIVLAADDNGKAINALNG